MSKVIKIFFLCFISLFICFLTYKLCYFIAEKYFFDKFFYQKSVTFGYGYYNYRNRNANFGERLKDLTSLESENTNILGLQDNQNFKIVIIGDSYVWGQGLKNNERLVKKLSDKLNKIKPTTIISLAKPGYSILDYLKIYNKSSKYYLPDLVIFALVQNDNLINELNLNSSIVQECLTLNSGLSATLDQDMGGNKSIFVDNKIQTYNDILTQAWKNPVNSCILDKGLNLLPTDKAIYFITEDYDGYSPHFKEFYKHLNNKYVISAKLGKDISKYTRYFNDPYKNFTISPNEGHPNALANQMYADILYNEIITNPRWGF